MWRGKIKDAFKALRRSDTASAMQLAFSDSWLTVRGFVITAMYKLIKELDTSPTAQTRFFQAVMLYDIYSSQHSDVLSSDCIPTLCAVLVRLCFKFEDTHDSDEGVERLASVPRVAAAVVDYLLIVTGGSPVMKFLSDADLKCMELDVLTSLQWRLLVPTLPDWIMLLSSRFDILSNGQIQETLRSLCPSLWPFLIYVSELLVWQCPNTAESAPSRVARGLMCLTWFASGALPALALGQSRAELLPPELSTILPQVATPSPHIQEGLLIALFAATNSNLANLQTDSFVTNILLWRPLLASPARGSSQKSDGATSQALGVPRDTGETSIMVTVTMI